VSADPGEWLYAPTWTRDGAAPLGARLEGTWLVLARPGPLWEAASRAVLEAGGAAVLVEPAEAFQEVEAARFRVRPGSAADLSAVVRRLRGAGVALRGAAHLWLAEAPLGDAVAVGYHALVALATALEPSPSAPVRVVVATEGGASVLDELVRRPEAALALGPVLTLPTELPGLRMRAVDLRIGGGGPALEAAARELVAELAAEDGEDVVARRAGRRWVRRVEKVIAPPPAPGALPLRKEGVYLVTGGLGGIGLTLAGWLAREASARLLLTARTPFPPREEWEAWTAAHPATDRTAQTVRALRAVEAAGGEVLVAAADATDEAAMRRALEEARARWGRVDGVIHAAGVSGNDRVALRKTDAEVRAVLAPKVEGLAVLVRLLGAAALDFVALVGSITSLAGGPGLCDYAAANAVLDAFPESTSRPAGWRRVLVLSFSAWREVGMATRVVVPEDRRRAWEEFLRAGIGPAAGVDAVARALASGRQQVAVTPFDLVDAMARARAPRAVDGECGAASPAAAVPAPAADGQDRSALSSPYQAPSTDTERRVAAIWSELLGVPRVGVHDDFFQLGGHSLLATRVLARIEEALGTRLTLRDVFDAPTVLRLSERIANAPGRATPAAGDGPQDDREELEF
jgi:NAD(P)-dependent dehydrogenase (short-subunit alcohol dehydrogenase family)